MKTILLIEDNTEVRENTAEILELANYKVLQAENGKLGVEIANENSIDLIICDIMMPVLDGYGVIHLLSKNTKTASIPFIFLTAKSERGDFRKGMEMGADDYITKPIKPKLLVSKVKALLRRLKNEESKMTIQSFEGIHIRPYKRNTRSNQPIKNQFSSESISSDLELIEHTDVSSRMKNYEIKKYEPKHEKSVRPLIKLIEYDDEIPEGYAHDKFFKNILIIDHPTLKSDYDAISKLQLKLLFVSSTQECLVLCEKLLKAGKRITAILWNIEIKGKNFSQDIARLENSTNSNIFLCGIVKKSYFADDMQGLGLKSYSNCYTVIPRPGS